MTCEVCRRPNGSQDYAPEAEGAHARGMLCLPCTLAVRQVETRIVTFRRILGYIKKYARRPVDSGRPGA